MSLWNLFGEVVSSVTEGVTDIMNAVVGEEESQEEGDKDLLTAINTVMAGTTEMSKAMFDSSMGLTQGVSGAIAAACAAGSTEEALGNAADVLTRSVATELMTGVRELSKGSQEVVKGVRHGIGACTEK